MRLTYYHHYLLGHSPSSNSCFRSHDTVHGRKSRRSYRKNGGPICASCQIIKKTFYTSPNIPVSFPFTPLHPLSQPSMMGSVNVQPLSLNLSNVVEKDPNVPSPPPTPTNGLMRNLSVTSLRRTNSTERKEQKRDVINIETPNPSHLYW